MTTTRTRALVAVLPALLLSLGCTAPHQAWTYPEGPSWGKTCEAGPPPQQSPIDFTQISTPRPVEAVTALSPVAQVAKGTFVDHDQNVVFSPVAWQPVSIDPAPGSQEALHYTPLGFHFHHRAEHKVGTDHVGLMEMHIKASDQLGKTAVFAVVMRFGVSTDPSLASVLPAVERAITSTGTSPVDLASVLRNFTTRPYYSYLGSLTTPQCDTGVRWYVLKEALGVTEAAINPLLSALIRAGMPEDNARRPRALTNPQPEVFLVSPPPPRP